MTSRAYVLIGTQSGKAGEVVQAIRKLAGVASVDAVTGPYDAIAIIVAEATNDIGEIIVSKMQPVAGISRTVTCLSLPEGGQS
jgi:DNA-binding Lrp family transcriptional regulator